MKKFLACVAVLIVLCSVAFADENVKLKSVEQLKTEKLAAQRGTVGQFIAEDLLGDKKASLLTTYEKYVDAVASLRQGKIRAIIMDEMPAKRFLQSVEGLAIMDEALSEENYAIGFRKGNTEQQSIIRNES